MYKRINWSRRGERLDGKKHFPPIPHGQAAFIVMAALLVLAVAAQPVLASAAGAAAIKNGMGDIYEIVAALVTSVGTILLLWGVFEWSTALQSSDGTLQSNAFKRMAGGLVATMAPQIIVGFVK